MDMDDNGYFRDFPPPPEAVSIYRDKDAIPRALRDVLDRPDICDLPLVVIPVAGEFRGGKSFLLSYFLRYLTKKNFGLDNEKLIGFEHKRSAQFVTEGINIWSEPLIVEDDEPGSTKKILVLLMDSQGVLGDEGDSTIATRIFALSVMLSSIMVFNLKGQLNRAVLDYLKLFVSYGKEVTANTASEKPFQKLMILIRDWQNSETYCYDGGEEYVNQFFKDGKNVFDSYFKDTSCFLLPHPGTCVSKKDFNGCLKDMDEGFTQHMKYLIKSLCTFDKLENMKKEVAGKILKAGEFCDYFESCAKLIDTVDWNQSCNFVQEQAKFICESEKSSALKEYKSNMDKHKESFWDEKNDSIMLSKTLKDYHKVAAIDAKKKYEEKCKFSQMNEPQIFEEYRNKLHDELEITYPAYEELRNEKYATYKMKSEITCGSEKNNALEEYKSVMDKKKNYFWDRETNIVMTKSELVEQSRVAENKASKIFEEKCRNIQMNVPQVFDKYKAKLIKELTEKYIAYEELRAYSLVAYMEKARTDSLLARTKAYRVYESFMENIAKDSFRHEGSQIYLTKEKLDEHHKEAIEKTRKKFEDLCKLNQMNEPEYLYKYKTELDKKLEELYPFYKKQLKEVLKEVIATIQNCVKSLRKLDDGLEVLKEELASHQTIALRSKLAAAAASVVAAAVCFTPLVTFGVVGIVITSITGTGLEVADRMMTGNAKENIKDISRRASNCLEQSKDALNVARQIIEDTSRGTGGLFDYVHSGIWGALTSVNAFYYLFKENTSFESASKLKSDIVYNVTLLEKFISDLNKQYKELEK